MKPKAYKGRKETIVGQNLFKDEERTAAKQLHFTLEMAHYDVTLSFAIKRLFIIIFIIIMIICMSTNYFASGSSMFTKRAGSYRVNNK